MHVNVDAADLEILQVRLMIFEEQVWCLCSLILRMPSCFNPN